METEKENSKNLKRKYEYESVTYLIGPSNSGKTTFFIKTFPEGVVVSNKKMSALGINIKSDLFLNLEMIKNLNKNEENDLINKYQCMHLLVDEIHFMNLKNFDFIRKIKANNIYISFLTGTWTNKQFTFGSEKPFNYFFEKCDNSNDINSLAEFFSYWSITPQVFIFKSNCEYCKLTKKNKLTISSFMAPDCFLENQESDLICDKEMFVPCCFDCAGKRQIPKNFTFQTRSHLIDNVGENLGKLRITFLENHKITAMNKADCTHFLDFFHNMHLFENVSFN